MTHSEAIRWLFQNFELATTQEINFVVGTSIGTVLLANGAEAANKRDMRERRDRKKFPILNPDQVSLMRKRIAEHRRVAA